MTNGTQHALQFVKRERERQIEKGYDAQHDDELGIDHIIIEANRRRMTYLGNGPRPGMAPDLYRQKLVEVAAMYVAAIEAMDRARVRAEPDDALTSGGSTS